ncbi:unnamed protein product [Phaedon cochleariae]|uniref:Zinc finger PHD-type domain-containing protein n=1 Tax=Phaedon cochleariae TaxID=80249 RepID=A0A9N9X7X6_PHACE|nr:unnamed protein product [Phaedon cochleariae]
MSACSKCGERPAAKNKIACRCCSNIYHWECTDISVSKIPDYNSGNLIWLCLTCSTKLESGAKKSGNSVNMKTDMAILNDIQATVQFISRQQAEFLKSLNDIKVDVESLKTNFSSQCIAVEDNTEKISALSETIQGLKLENQQLQMKMNKIDQAGRFNCLEVTGVPEPRGENVFVTVQLLGVALGAPSPDLSSVDDLSSVVGMTEAGRSFLTKLCRLEASVRTGRRGGENERTKERKNERTKERKNERTKERKNERTKERKNERTKERKNERTKERKNERTKERKNERTKERKNERTKERKNERTKERKNERTKERKNERTKERKNERTKERKNERTKERKNERTKERKNERTKERKNERTKERKNERTKERKNERTKERKNERTKERKNERTKERKNERTKERKNERTKERKNERKNGKTKEQKNERKNEKTKEQNIG